MLSAKGQLFVSECVRRAMTRGTLIGFVFTIIAGLASVLGAAPAAGQEDFLRGLDALQNQQWKDAATATWPTSSPPPPARNDRSHPCADRALLLTSGAMASADIP